MCVVLVFLLCAASMDASPTARVPSAVAADFTMGGTNQNISDSDGVLTESDASAVAATLALCRTFRTLVAILGRMDGHPTPTAVAFCRDVLSGLRASLSGSTVLLFLSVEDRQVCLCGTDSTVVPEYVASVIVGHMRRDLTRRLYGAAVLRGTALVLDYQHGRLPLPAESVDVLQLALPLWPATSLLLSHWLWVGRQARHLAGVSLLLGAVSIPFLGLLHFGVCLIILVFYGTLRRHAADARHQGFLHALIALRRLQFDPFSHHATTPSCGVCMSPLTPGASIVTYPCGHIVFSKCASFWQHKLLRCVCPICELPISNAKPSSSVASAGSANSIAGRNAMGVLDTVKTYYEDVAALYDVDAVMMPDTLDVSWSMRKPE